jgi:hypothetical protein
MSTGTQDLETARLTTWVGWLLALPGVLGVLALCCGFIDRPYSGPAVGTSVVSLLILLAFPLAALGLLIVLTGVILTAVAKDKIDAENRPG